MVKYEPKKAGGTVRTTYFHAWVDKVSQVVPNGAQNRISGSPKLQNEKKNVYLKSHFRDYPKAPDNTQILSSMTN